MRAASTRAPCMRFGEVGPGSDCAVGDTGDTAVLVADGDGAAPIGEEADKPRRLPARAGGAPSSAAMFEIFDPVCEARISYSLCCQRSTFQQRLSQQLYPKERKLNHLEPEMAARKSMHEQPCQRACARATPVRTHPDMCMYHLNECHPNTPPRIARPTDSTVRIRSKGDTQGIGCAIDTDADAQN